MHATTTRDPMTRKLTRAELTAAIARSARRHGYYARTVREVSALRYRAIAEYRCEVLSDNG